MQSSCARLSAGRYRDSQPTPETRDRLAEILAALQQENRQNKPILVKSAPDLTGEAIAKVVAVAKQHYCSRDKFGTNLHGVGLRRTGSDRPYSLWLVAETRRRGFCKH